MPNRLTVEFYNSTVGEYWTNVYHTTLDSAGVGASIAALTAAHVAGLTADSVLTKVRWDDNVPLTDNYFTVAINTAGSLTAKGATLVPLFVTCRIDFNVLGGGRPCRKYIRSLLSEAGMSFNSITSDDLTNMTALGNAIAAVDGLCDPQGNEFTTAVVWPYPQMRQLRRGSKKKTTP